MDLARVELDGWDFRIASLIADGDRYVLGKRRVRSVATHLDSRLFVEAHFRR